MVATAELNYLHAFNRVGHQPLLFTKSHRIHQPCRLRFLQILESNQYQHATHLRDSCLLAILIAAYIKEEPRSSTEISENALGREVTFSPREGCYPRARGLRC